GCRRERNLKLAPLAYEPIAPGVGRRAHHGQRTEYRGEALPAVLPSQIAKSKGAGVGIELHSCAPHRQTGKLETRYPASRVRRMRQLERAAAEPPAALGGFTSCAHIYGARVVAVVRGVIFVVAPGKRDV